MKIYTETAQNLLALLKDAAETGDFAVTAEVLKRMLQPCGLSLTEDGQEEPDTFTKEDVDIISDFWNTLLNLGLDDEEAAMKILHLYSLIFSASFERKFPYMTDRARQHCTGIALLCGEMLEELAFTKDLLADKPEIRTRPRLYLVKN